MRALAAFVLMFVGSLAGCGQTEKSRLAEKDGRAATPIDACKLLKSAAESPTVHLTFDTSEFKPPKGPTNTCSYATVPAPEQAIMSLTISREPIEPSVRKWANGWRIEPINGLGDRAFFGDQTGILVQKGPLLAAIYISDFYGTASKETHVQLAREVLKGL